VRGLADEIMDGVKGRFAERWREPVQNGSEDGGGVFGGKSVGGSEEDNHTPEQGGPPGAEPAGNHGFGRNAVTNLVEIGGGPRIAPWFGR